VDGQWLTTQDQDRKGADGLQAWGDYISDLLICGIIPISFLLSNEVGMSYILPGCFVTFYFCGSWLKSQFSSATGMLAPHICRQFLSWTSYTCLDCRKGYLGKEREAGRKEGVYVTEGTHPEPKQEQKPTPCKRQVE
jgi:hypothetical protein